MKLFVLLMIMSFSSSVRAESVIDILGCKLHVSSSFTMRFSTDGQFFLDGTKQDGNISVMRYSEIKWVNPGLLPKPVYENYGKLESRTSFATKKMIKVFLLTDRHNVVMFFGPAADDWHKYVMDCD